MAKIALCLLLVFFCPLVYCEKQWVLLVAGSNGWANYRHQADICHAYHIVKDHGIPDDNIIVMMYDDIANNDLNPVKGQIINYPNGTNIYEGVPKHYTKEEVTPEVFLKVLAGDAEGVKKLLGREGKVIKSGSSDRVFVNFVDHGVAGLLLFPNETVLHAEDLHATIKKMHADKKYKQFVFYVEACYSGSIFENILESNINVFATTAANASEESSACYFDEERNTYLSDVYSAMWMQDSDEENLNSETLNEQYDIVKKETTTSHVMRYGDNVLGTLKVGDFQGNSKIYKSSKYEQKIDCRWDGISSKDVQLEILKRKVAKYNGLLHEQYESELAELLKQRNDTEEFFRHVVDYVAGVKFYDFFATSPVCFTSFKCYRQSVTLLQKLCPGIKLTQNDFAQRRMTVLANLCEVHNDVDVWSAVAKVSFRSPLCS